ncbi:MAG: replicative DNA helicase [Candidatus Brocadiaceae bacterium]|nr:replicative DNA helicase [Candidatus Brocadiaceae bacterium]
MSDANAAPLVPPHDLQAEMGVLGSMLLSQDAAYIARERLAEASFYKLAHQDVFRAILALADSHGAVDLILLCDELEREGRLEKAGGRDYLLELMEAVPTSANVEYYVEIVRENAIRRLLIQTAGEIEKRSFVPAEAVDHLLDEAESQILAVRSQKDSGQVRNVTDVLQSIVARLEELHQHPGQLTGLASGYYDLDDLTGGFQPGEFIVIAARPSMGKTTLTLNILHHVCAVQRRPAALYSLEMPAEQIVSNFLCIHNRIDSHDFRRGTLKDKDWKALEDSLGDLSEMPLFIDDSPSLRILDLRARARRLAHRHRIELIAVDYLQLLSANKGHENRATEVAEISQGLKALARELRVPLIAVAQLSRRVEQEQRRPRLSDLRESGAIEQDADVVLMLHRPQEAGEEIDDVAGNEADLIIGKQRNGPIGQARLIFQKRFLRFESRATSAAPSTVPY